LRLALRRDVSIHWRADGKPEVSGVASVSTSHAGDLTMAVVGTGPLGCDLEPVAQRPPDAWRDLLGLERFALAEVLARESGEDLDASATRVWAAVESSEKAGVPAGGPLVFVANEADGWTLLATGPLIAAVFVASTPAGRLVIAISGGRPWHASTNIGTSSASRRPTSSGTSTM
jgi:enediyne polyketide synthase